MQGRAPGFRGRPPLAPGGWPGGGAPPAVLPGGGVRPGARGEIEQRRYGRGEEVLGIPDLTELQIKSYEDFLQADVPASERADSGLESIIREIFPIESYDKSMRLVYLGYDLGKPRYTPNECRLL